MAGHKADGKGDRNKSIMRKKKRKKKKGEKRGRKKKRKIYKRGKVHKKMMTKEVGLMINIARKEDTQKRI